MNPPASERRKHPRLEQTIPIKISSEETDVVTETYNLSCAGAYCKVNKYFEPMTRISIHLLLPLKRRGKTVTKKLTCHGVVVRTESIPGQDYYKVAIFFSDILPADTKVISEYVSGQMKAGPSQDVPLN